MRSIVLSINSVVKNQHVVTDLHKELEAKRKDNRFLTQRLQYVRENDFVEQEARERLGMVRNGEVIVLLPSPHSTPLTQPITENTQPNWKKWWNLFF